MKYWLFDGGDVIGPFSPEELAARADFSAVSLIAPETNSEDQNDWKVASSFEEFEWDEQTGALKIVPPPQEQVPEQEQTAVPSMQPQEKTAPGEPPVPQVHPQQPPLPTPIALVKPIVLAEGTDDIISLPVHDNPVAPQTVEPEPEAQADHPRELPTTVAVPAQAQPASTMPPTQEIPSTSSQLPTVDQIPPAGTWEESSDLDDPFANAEREVTLPPELVPQELVPPAEPVSEKEPVKEVEEPVSPQETAPGLLGNTEPLTTPGIGVRKVLKPHLTQTPEISTFLQEQKESHRPGRRKAKLMLWILFLLLIPGVVALAVHRKQAPDNPSPQKPVVAQPPAVVQEPDEQEQNMARKSVVQTTPQEPVDFPPSPAPKTTSTSAKPTLSEQAIETVKKHPLPNNRGTVDSYLGRMYKTQVSSGGYESEWSAEPLHKNIYIVKYRLTKTRNEPIVYVFQVDVSKGKVVGALNNITLDLLGKI